MHIVNDIDLDSKQGCYEWIAEFLRKTGATCREFAALETLAQTGTVGSRVWRRTVKSQCPVCAGVIVSVLIKYGVTAIMACPHCASMISLDVEDVTP